MSHAWAVTEPACGPERSTPSGVERDPARVVALSDAVIAITVTLLVAVRGAERRVIQRGRECRADW
jgi:hypothetical protein